MRLKKTTSLLTTIYIFLFFPLFSFSQIEQENTLTNAIQLFDKMKYAEAESLFKKVLDENPEDFMVNYFYGVCRTENNHFTNADLECLIIANQEVSPININYYFGVQYHARSNWERALKFYNKFNSAASLAENEKQNILEKIQQCYDKINPFAEYMLKQSNEDILSIEITNDSIPENISSENTNEISDSSIESETILIIKRFTETEPGNNIPAKEPVHFTVNSNITYLYTSHFKTKDGKSLFDKGNSKQKELESTLIKVEELRENYSLAKTREEKNIIGKKILTLENESYTLKNDATQFLLQAKNIEKEYWENATPGETEEFIEELNQISKEKDTKTVRIEEDTIESSTFIDPNILLGNKELVSPNEESLNNDLVYKIQIGAYSRGLPNYIKQLFKKLSFIRKIENYTDEKGVVVYTTGNLRNLEDAEKMKKQVQQEGVEDAYVVPYFKGKRITLGQANELEGER